MSDQFKRENNLAEKIRSTAALQELSEYELKELQHHILSLQNDLQRIPLFDDELVEEVTSTQGLLNKWHDLVERALAVKQRHIIYDQLSNWDNEGGRVPYASH